MGNPFAAAGFKDRVEARWMSRVPLHRMARRYVFLNSQYCYRPLWTTIAEARGARVELLFYSANTESIQFQGWDPVPIPGYRGMRWPCCLVWDQAQAGFVQEVAGASTECRVIGPVNLSDDSSELPAFATPALAIFDVPVQTDLAIASKGIAGTYYSPQTVAAFIDDVTACAQELGVCAVLKGKRDLGTNVHPEYRHALDRAAQRGAVTLDERVAAGRLLEHVQAAISIPFTSPAINGALRGMPSAYYDPTGTVTRPQRADHGVEVLHGRQELRVWMSHHLPCARR
jgi:polysaccharide biosynthesis PFTS motif protein